MSDDLREAILRSLNESGTPLEMRVAAEFIRARRHHEPRPAFNPAVQSHYYWDKVGEVNREIDLGLS